jgi:RimJ/RimL family protein N-acetyltransferase
VARPAPAAVVSPAGEPPVPGEVVTRLRPARPEEARTLQRWREQVLSPFEDFRGPPPPGVSAAVQPLPAGSGELAVADDADRLLGSVGWRPVAHGPNAGSQAVEIGISLHASARRRGHGTRAQRMLAEHLFATTGVHRVQASTDVDNVAEQGALERAGFRREGVLRGAQWRAGVFHDLVAYARLRTDAPPHA